jgi:glyoxylase-like metal-dependent hydrolase (beta-lactamase superfamily II)
MAQQIPISSEARADDQYQDTMRNDRTHEVRGDLAYLRCAIVNVAFYGPPSAGDRGWVLIDAGIAGSRLFIERAAQERFGPNARPAAIILTHGHFDHVGSVEGLAEAWDVPVYAHALERPYLSGQQSYPPPDPSVGGGLIALTSPLMPRGPIDLGARLRDLPDDGSVPFMAGWRWLHTPGHTPGHVSLWQETQRTLIAGDAFVTTAQESIYSVAMQEAEIHGPPMYFTPDWGAAEDSVRKLAQLKPEIALTGHGRPMKGQQLRAALDELAQRFKEVAVPKHAAK